MRISFPDTTDRYGMISVVLHWLIAAIFIGLFGVGCYMVTLGYYDPWYTTLPHWHKSIGLLMIAVVVLRGAWRVVIPRVRGVAAVVISIGVVPYSWVAID